MLPSCNNVALLYNVEQKVASFYFRNNFGNPFTNPFILKLENVAIANALQLEAARRHATPHPL